MLSKYRCLPGCRLVLMLLQFELGNQTLGFSDKKNDSGRPGYSDKKVIRERLKIPADVNHKSATRVRPGVMRLDLRPGHCGDFRT